MPSALWVLARAMLVIRSAEVFYVPIMPLYARLLDTTVPLFVVGLATSVDRLGAVVVSPVAGRWADRVGRRRPYLIGVGLTAVASVLGGVAVGMVDLVAYRLVSGIGYGVLTIAAMSYVSEITSTRSSWASSAPRSAASCPRWWRSSFPRRPGRQWAFRSHRSSWASLLDRRWPGLPLPCSTSPSHCSGPAS